jgi:hypothetical protein
MSARDRDLFGRRRASKSRNPYRLCDRVWRDGERNFRKERRSNETHASTTDRDARLYRKADGRGSRLCFMAHVLMENRNGLAVDAALTHATGTAEREATLAMLDRRKSRHWITLGADRPTTWRLS